MIFSIAFASAADDAIILNEKVKVLSSTELKRDFVFGLIATPKAALDAPRKLSLPTVSAKRTAARPASCEPSPDLFLMKSIADLPASAKDPPIASETV